MKHRRLAVIISLLIALIGMFALPVQAQTSGASISNLELEGYSDAWCLLWDRIDNTASAQVQVKGGGIMGSWTSLSILRFQASITFVRSDGSAYYKSEACVQNLSSHRVGGQSFNLRVRVRLSDGSGTNWAQISA